MLVQSTLCVIFTWEELSLIDGNNVVADLAVIAHAQYVGFHFTELRTRNGRNLLLVMSREGVLVTVACVCVVFDQDDALLGVFVAADAAEHAVARAKEVMAVQCAEAITTAVAAAAAAMAGLIK